MRFLPNPTDPDAGTNRTNAVSRDNLMNGAGLGYVGSYNEILLYNVGIAGHWWSSTVSDNSNNAYRLYISLNDSLIRPRAGNNKNTGRAVRYTIQILVLLIHYLGVWG